MESLSKAQLSFTEQVKRKIATYKVVLLFISME